MEGEQLISRPSEAQVAPAAAFAAEVALSLALASDSNRPEIGETEPTD